MSILIHPVIRLVALCCVALCVACNGATDGTGETLNTEVDLLISDPDTPPEEILLLIDFVS